MSEEARMAELPDDATEALCKTVGHTLATHPRITGSALAALANADGQTAVELRERVLTVIAGAAFPLIAARVRAEALPRCERTEDHLRHDLPVTVHCDGVGPQVCNPERYQHLGPWETVKPWQDVRRCTACGTEIGK